MVCVGDYRVTYNSLMRLWVTSEEWLSLKEKLLVRIEESLHLFLAIVTDHFDAVNVTDMIEKNVEDVAVNVDEGNRQLEKGVTFKVCGKCASL